MKSSSSLWPTLARVAAGLFFVVSAVAKLFSVDSFEVYIFTYGFFSLETSYLLARACIFVEVAVGIMLILGCWPRVGVGLGSVMTLLFTIFLCYAALKGRTDSCHCMGNMVQFSPVQSIVKNSMLLLALLYARRSTKWQCRPRWYVAAPVLAAILVAVFAISVPDNWRYGSSKEPYNAKALSQMLSNETLSAVHGEHRVLAFVTTGCGYCQLAADKLLSIQRRHHLDSAAFIFVAPEPVEPASNEVLSPSNFGYHLNRIDVDQFIAITYGQRPLVLQLDGDSVAATYHLRNINERDISRWLTR
ncbi:MAG: DoxX family protein [Bacteroidales bacterium]|nr:DoxX family protein [Bacteroidales bacterium]